MGIAHLKDRAVLRVSGEDARPFLQSLITQDINLLRADNLLYSLLLTPQGRYAVDFFLKDAGDAILVDVHKQHQERLLALLTRYKLRQRVSLAQVDDLQVWALWGEALSRPLPIDCRVDNDPRLKQLGVRNILRCKDKVTEKSDDYYTHQLSLGVTDSAYMIPEQSIPLEYGLHRLNGIALDKGCYLGQELITRTLHRGEIRRRILPARILEGTVQTGEAVQLQDKEIGKVIGAYKNWVLARVLFQAVMPLRSADEPILRTSTGHPLRLHFPDWMAKA